MALKLVGPRDTWVIVAAFSTLSGVLGFAYGNVWEEAGFQMKEWQTLLAAFVPALGVLGAWIMASQTLRFNAFSQEERRIENDELPKLIQVTDWLSRITYTLPEAEKRQIWSWLENEGINITQTSIEAKVDKAIGSQDTPTKQRITGLLTQLYFASKRLDGIERDGTQLREMTAQSRPLMTDAEVDVSVANYATNQGKPHVEAAIDGARDDLLSLYDGLRKRRKEIENRRDRLRAWIEHYFQTEIRQR
jgi:hypothetical protein